MDKHGAPQAFYHDNAPVELKDLFVMRFDELFGQPGELNYTTYLELEGPPIGGALLPEIDEWFKRGNIYKYLCQPIGHEHLLDMRIRFGGIGRALMLFWNQQGSPFGPAHVALLEPVRDLMQGAIASERQDAKWMKVDDAGGHLVTDGTGRQLLGIDAKAEASLISSHLIAQHIPMAGQIRQAPAFAYLLAGMVDQGVPARLELPVPHGRLVARATPMRGAGPAQPDESTNCLLSIQVDFEVPAEIMLVDQVIKMPLTPLQRRIALFAMLGRRRADCAAHFAISEEALKKHLRSILEVTGAGSWAELVKGEPSRAVSPDLLH